MDAPVAFKLIRFTSAQQQGEDGLSIGQMSSEDNGPTRHILLD